MSEFSERVTPSVIIPIRFTSIDKTFEFNSAVDTVMHFPWLNAYLARYVDAEGMLSLLTMDEVAGQNLRDQNFPIWERESISTPEHKIMIDGLANLIKEDTWDLDIDVEAIEDEFRED